MAKFEFKKCTNIYVENLFSTVDNSFKFLFEKIKKKLE